VTPRQRAILHAAADRVADAYARSNDLAPQPLREFVRYHLERAVEMNARRRAVTP
jgi:hypothetical protein